MLGPVLYLEMLLGSRRGKQYVFRYIYAGWLLFLVVCVCLAYGIHLMTHGNDLAPPFGDGFLSDAAGAAFLPADPGDARLCGRGHHR